MKVLGFGAVLWDDISRQPGSSGMNIGGSVFNVAAHIRRLGDKASMLSAVGNDALGAKTLDAMQALGVGTAYTQRVEAPTCLVRVRFDGEGQPYYSVDDYVSWDLISVGDADLDAIRDERFDVLCFGTLEQRNPVSRETLRRVLEQCVFGRVYLDLTLRAPDYTAEVVEYSLAHCTIAKMNFDEAVETNRLLGMGAKDLCGFSERLMGTFPIQMVVVTLGARGAYYFDGVSPGWSAACDVRVVDTVGAGDAFSAGLLHRLGHGDALKEACDFAARLGSLICSAHSSIPDWRMDQVYALQRLPQDCVDVSFR